jgi:hypothetical protein
MLRPLLLANTGNKGNNVLTLARRQDPRNGRKHAVGAIFPFWCLSFGALPVRGTILLLRISAPAFILPTGMRLPEQVANIR